MATKHRIKKSIRDAVASNTAGRLTNSARRTSTRPDRSGVGRSGRFVTRQARYRDIRAAMGLSTG